MSTGVRSRSRSPLSREIILDAAMRRVRTSGRRSLAQLGRELGADPTAMYRHYRGKDEFLRGMADRVYGEALAEIDDTLWNGPWRVVLHELEWAIRRVYLQYPGLAVDMAPRFTGGENERLLSERLRHLLRVAGLDPVAASRYSRVVSELTLGLLLITAWLMTLPPSMKILDAEIGLRLYPEVHPPTSGGDDSDALDDEEFTFALALDAMLDGVGDAVALAAAGRASVAGGDVARGATP